MTLGNLKQAMQDEAKKHFKRSSFRGKPIEDILEHIVFNTGGAAALRTRITDAKADFQAVKAEAQNLNSTDIYDNFSTDSDANMISFVGTHMPGLTNDIQRLAVAVVLQRI